MNSVVLSDAQVRAKENSKKRKLLEITTVLTSELPHRVAKKRTGVLLGSFKTTEEVNRFIEGYPLAHLESKPTRRRAVR